MNLDDARQRASFHGRETLSGKGGLRPSFQRPVASTAKSTGLGPDDIEAIYRTAFRNCFAERVA